MASFLALPSIDGNPNVTAADPTHGPRAELGVMLDALVQAQEAKTFTEKRQGASNRLNDTMNEGLKYALGPHANTLTNANALINPLVNVDQSQRLTRIALDDTLPAQERMMAAAQALLEIGAFTSPTAVASVYGRSADDVARGLSETFANVSSRPEAAALRDFGASESGAIRAYHGSPHDFDEFRMDRIGTGEGAQAYGHGLYFADNEDVARSYRDALSDQYTKVDGVRVHKTGHGGRRFGDLDVNQRALLNELQSSADAGGLTAKEVILERLAQIDARMGTYLKQSQGDDFGAQLAKGHLKRNADQKELLTELLDAGVEFENTGRMYEVNIDANPEDFLDWDKPLSEQSANVQEIYRNMMKKRSPWLDDSTIPNARGEQMVGDASGLIGRDAQSQALQDAGIPGIKYLDQGSRGAPPPTVKQADNGFEVYWGNDPKPVDTFSTREAAERAAKEIDGRSSNYVVFDENLISIIKKYGIAGAAAMLGMSAGDLQAQAESAMPEPQGLL